VSTRNFQIFLFYNWKAQCHDEGVKKDENINVRLDPDLKRRVDRVSQGIGTTPSVLIRLLLERFISHTESHKGMVVMPPEFRAYDIKEKR
jgi:hypothetical protein